MHGRTIQSYVGWWGHDTLPKLNYEGSEELLDRYHAWNCSRNGFPRRTMRMAGDLMSLLTLGHSAGDATIFSGAEFRECGERTANPEAIILAEHYGDPYRHGSRKVTSGIPL